MTTRAEFKRLINTTGFWNMRVCNDAWKADCVAPPLAPPPSITLNPTLVPRSADSFFRSRGNTLPQLDAQFNLMWGENVGTSCRDWTLYLLRSATSLYWGRETGHAEHYTPPRFNFSIQHLGCVSVIAAVNHPWAGCNFLNCETTTSNRVLVFLCAHIATQGVGLYPRKHCAKSREMLTPY